MINVMFLMAQQHQGRERKGKKQFTSSTKLDKTRQLQNNQIMEMNGGNKREYMFFISGKREQLLEKEERKGKWKTRVYKRSVNTKG